MLKRYAFEYQNGVGLETWVTDTLVEIGVPFESLFAVLEDMFYGDEAPFQGPNARYVVRDLLHVVRLWYQHTSRGHVKVLGSEESAAAVSETLQMVLQSGMLDATMAEECRILRGRIEATLR